MRVCAKSEAATVLTAAAVFGLLSNLLAVDATFGEVCFVLVFVDMVVFQVSTRKRRAHVDEFARPNVANNRIAPVKTGQSEVLPGNSG